MTNIASSEVEEDMDSQSLKNIMKTIFLGQPWGLAGTQKPAIGLPIPFSLLAVLPSLANI